MPTRLSPRARILAALVGFGLAAASAAACPALALAAPPPSAAKPHRASAAKGPSGVKAGSKTRKEDKKKSSRAPAAAPGAPGEREASAPRPAPPPEVTAIALNLERLTLGNGLRVVLSPMSGSPTVAVAVTYDAGLRSEARGQSGFARLVEHLMFQGSKNVEPGEHARLVEERGGAATSAIDPDRASFVEVLPASELALGLFLEADRMKAMDLREESLARGRERPLRGAGADSASSPSALRLRELVYQGYFPYEHSPEGAAVDLAGVTLEAVSDFHARRYGPSGAVLTLTGDFDPEEAHKLVHQYFDGVPRSDVAPLEEAALPEQTSQRTAVMRDPAARAPAIFYGFAIPPSRSADHYPLELAAIMLGGGESSRLHQLLVRDRGIARLASAETHGLRGPDLFSIAVELGEEAKVGDVEKLIEGEIKALATAGPSEAELDKARRQVQSRLLLALESNPQRALLLGDHEALFGDARLLEGELARTFAVTREDVKRAVAQHLGPTRRSIVETYPTSADLPKADAARPKGDAAPQPSAEASGARKAGKGTGERKPKKGAGAPAKPKKPRKGG